MPPDPDLTQRSGPRPRTLAELALLFLKLGAVSIGGPAAHIALTEEETVARRKWLPRAQFLDMIAATDLIPGPNAVEMAIWIGYLRARWAGLVVAGLAFISSPARSSPPSSHRPTPAAAPSRSSSTCSVTASTSRCWP